MKIFNTLSGNKDTLVPLKDNLIKMYICGMTVYDDTHIGHARTFLSFDVIVRYLRSLDYEVHYIRNITDVDDKILERSKELGIGPMELTDKYIDSMNDDFSALNMIKPDSEPRATHNIESIIKLIQKLIDKGHAYVGESDVYFSTESYSEYGKLSRRKLEDMLAGARVEVDSSKRNPADFVLWKKDTEGLKWGSPWGEGRPGWHVECSAMSMDALGETFDIHGGGADLKFPHHENEIAQSECATGKEFARIWMHTGPLRIDKEKMSKSLKNFITIKDALEKNSSEILRFFLISSHYRSPLNYSEEGLLEAKNSLDRLYNSIKDVQLHDVLVVETEFSKRFHKAMQDDFNSPSAISVLFEMARQINTFKKEKDLEKAAQLSKELVNLSDSLGILQDNPQEYFTSGVRLSDQEIEEYIEKREQARADKDFLLSDKIRDELLEKGIALEDSNSGTIWKRV